MGAGWYILDCPMKADLNALFNPPLGAALQKVTLAFIQGSGSGVGFEGAFFFFGEAYRGRTAEIDVQARPCFQVFPNPGKQTRNWEIGPKGYGGSL